MEQKLIIKKAEELRVKIRNLMQEFIQECSAIPLIESRSEKPSIHNDGTFDVNIGIDITAVDVAEGANKIKGVLYASELFKKQR